MKKINQRIGFIGCGNMGSAILSGLIQNKIATRNKIYLYDSLKPKMKSLSKKFGVKSTQSSLDLIEQAQIVILAIKPQDLNTLAQEIRKSISSKHVLISILAGTPIQKLKKAFGNKASFVRAMPNLGAQVGKSVTAVTSAQRSALSAAQTIFQGCGEVVQLPESHFDLVTAISGSGPAYFFLMMELLMKAGENKGLSKENARLLAVQTALGAAELARNSHAPAELRKQVTSKKGTTDAALQYLWKKDFSHIFLGAIDQAVKRARQLSKL